MKQLIVYSFIGKIIIHDVQTAPSHKGGGNEQRQKALIVRLYLHKTLCIVSLLFWGEAEIMQSVINTKRKTWKNSSQILPYFANAFVPHFFC